MELMELVKNCTDMKSCEGCTSKKDCERFKRVIKNMTEPWELRRFLEEFGAEVIE